MKIKINYDLIDKISEAKQGYSLKRCVKRTGAMLGISGSVSTFDCLVSGGDVRLLPIAYLIHLGIHSSYTAMYTYAFKDYFQRFAEAKLDALIPQLHSIHVRCDMDSLLESYKYDSEYKLVMSSGIPSLEQRKYIKVPVHDSYFGDKEMSIMQEHIVGTGEYELSLGEPEEKKVYSLRRQAMPK